MSWTTKVLVVAAVTAESPELTEAMTERAAAGPTAFTLVVPARELGNEARAHAEQQLQSALATAREAGLTIEGQVGDHDPIVAVQEAFDPRSVDSVIVSTLPVDVSRWLNNDLPQRVAKLTGVPVQHVICAVPLVRPTGEPAPVHLPHHDGLLTPLRALDPHQKP
ncbi:MAG TPA: hypothetical protein VHX88_16180 [Solirubrobacteraceae bacterium]|jgi:GABA permease|nr:hypothetical protein [Solirubrobacteraceae bacterium]